MQMHTAQSLLRTHGIARPARETPLVAGLIARLRAFAEYLGDLRRAARDAAILREMDDRMLHDIGITRSQIDAAVRGLHGRYY
jgi:uncharacterized protein YjiS (DUF1127 family)